jgi:hypothetical protein
LKLYDIYYNYAWNQRSTYLRRPMQKQPIKS